MVCREPPISSMVLQNSETVFWPMALACSVPGSVPLEGVAGSRLVVGIQISFHIG